MYAVPSVDEVVAVAKELGIHLNPDEAVLYRTFLLEQLSQFDAFVQARLEESKPPMVSATRTPGYRPTAEEDPLNAWTWKCRIEGAAGGGAGGAAHRTDGREVPAEGRRGGGAASEPEADPRSPRSPEGGLEPE